MAIQFPENPPKGTIITSDNGAEFVWDGEKWVSELGSIDRLEFFAEPPLVVNRNEDEVLYILDLTTLPSA